MPKEDHQVLDLGFINPILDSDNKAGSTFKPERSFLYLSLHLGFVLFPIFLKSWKLTHVQNFKFQHNCKTKMFQIILIMVKLQN